MIYSALISDYVNREVNRSYSSTHKKSDLKKIYSDIVKISKDSPSYIIPPSIETQTFALQLKSGSLSLQDTLEKLQNGGLTSAFSYKEVHCDNENAIGATIDTEDHSRLPEPFTIEINRLATRQVNVGDYVYCTTNRLTGGHYAFQLNVEEDAYCFEIDMAEKTSNEAAMKQMANAINRSPAEVTASINYDKAQTKLRMTLTSERTGSTDGNPIFSISDTDYPIGSYGMVDLFGVNQLQQRPENSSFFINGEEKSTVANEFTLNNSLHVTMHQETTEPVHVTFKSNSSRILNEIDTLADTYNQLVTLSYHQGDPPQLATLMLHDLKNVFASAKTELEDCGVTFQKDGYMEIDESVARVAAQNGKFEKLFGHDNTAGVSAIGKSKMFSLDPMKYIEDKVVVTYPNPQKEHFANPYMTSIYSGMLFNSYC